MAIIYATSCSQDDVETAYYNVSGPGDTVVIPTGFATWGASNRSDQGKIYIGTGNAFTFVGQGSGTVITLDDTGPEFAAGIINILGTGITFSGITIIGSNVNPVTAFYIAPFSQYTANNFRLTNITYAGNNGTAYFAYISASSGIIDNCILGSANGSTELIFTRGDGASWQSPPTLGSANAVYIEDCHFTGQGYVCDANSNARIVVRHNIIDGPQKVDGHGVASNTPARSYREMEVYNNTWTNTGNSFWTAIEPRGGSPIIFNNSTAAPPASNVWMFLTDYSYLNPNPNFGNQFQTLANYPIQDQIGVGEDPQVAHSQPGYVFGNKQSSSPWARAFHTPEEITLGTTTGVIASGATTIPCTPSAVGLWVGNNISFAGDPNFYLSSSNTSNGAPNIFIFSGLKQAIASGIAISYGAQTQYQAQILTTGATFTESDVIHNNRDFYADAGFDQLTGVSIGTTAQMTALTPTVTGYGFWVTDQGSWNTTVPSGTAGLLYTWSGGWNLYYTPYTYPHPLRGAVSTGSNPMLIPMLRRIGSHLKLSAWTLY